MMSTVAMITAQNIGAGFHDRGRLTLKYCIRICIFFGLIFFAAAQFFGAEIVGLFVKDDPTVVVFGAQYFSTYAIDCILGGIQFSFSGYFNAYQKSWITFMHNTVSILLVRIPGAYLASVLFPHNLVPMGLAAPLGSLVSVIICVICYRYFRRHGFMGEVS